MLFSSLSLTSLRCVRFFLGLRVSGPLSFPWREFNRLWFKKGGLTQQWCKAQCTVAFEPLKTLTTLSGREEEELRLFNCPSRTSVRHLFPKVFASFHTISHKQKKKRNVRHHHQGQVKALSNTMPTRISKQIHQAAHRIDQDGRRRCGRPGEYNQQAGNCVSRTSSDISRGS